MVKPRFERFGATPHERREDAPKPGSWKEVTLLWEERLPNASPEERAEFEAAKALFKELGQAKREHSRNVFVTAAKILPKGDVLLGALLHDTKERAPGAFAAHAGRLSEPVRLLIDALSEEEHDELPEEDAENTPLARMQSILPTLDQHVKNRVIAIKLADRLDNLLKRGEQGKIKKAYRKKSRELLSYLATEYAPDAEMNEAALFELGETVSTMLKCENPFTPSMSRAA